MSRDRSLHTLDTIKYPVPKVCTCERLSMRRLTRWRTLSRVLDSLKRRTVTGQRGLKSSSSPMSG